MSETTIDGTNPSQDIKEAVKNTKINIQLGPEHQEYLKTLDAVVNKNLHARFGDDFDCGLYTSIRMVDGKKRVALELNKKDDRYFCHQSSLDKYPHDSNKAIVEPTRSDMIKLITILEAIILHEPQNKNTEQQAKYHEYSWENNKNIDTSKIKMIEE